MMKSFQSQVVEIALILAVISSQNEVKSLSSNYLEVYPDPRDPEVLKGRTPLYFALIQSLGRPPSQFGSSGSVAGVKVALDRINNDSSLLPGYTLHYTFSDSACNRTVSLDALHYQLFQEPRKIAILGSGCSVATEPTAEVSHYYNVTQISCVSSSTALRNRNRFPRHFQLLSTAELLAFGFYGIILEYGWQKIALIVQDENLFTVTMGRLKSLLRTGNIEFSERIFNTSTSVGGLGSDIFDTDSRIYLLSMYASHARRVLCEAFKQNIYLPRNLLITIGWYSRFWWRVQQPDLTCTVAQRERVLPSTLAVTDEIFLDEQRDRDLQTTPGITGGEFLSEERKFLQKPPLNVSFSQLSQYCHDATWTLAYALNSTINSLEDNEVNEAIAESLNITPPFKLEDYSYDNRKLLEVIFGHLEKTFFNGVTGPVRFDSHGTRELQNLIAFQYREKVNVTDQSMAYLDIVEIGRIAPDTLEFLYAAGESFDTVWNDFELPYDGVPLKKFVTVHPAVASVYTILACAGIAFAIICLIFNFIFRKTKLLRLAGFKLNFLIGIGAIVIYIGTIIVVIPSTNQNTISVCCNLTPWFIAIGFTLCYGTITAKMVRVFLIFYGPPMLKKEVLKDKSLALQGGILLGIDSVILVTYTLVEGIRGNLAAQEAVHREEPIVVGKGPQSEITNFFIYVCDSTARDAFLAILYGYKLVFQGVAIFFAFATRRVSIQGLDRSEYIGASIYVTSVVLILTMVATYFFKNSVNGFAASFSTGFQIGTTIILYFVFVTLMINLYKDPEGKNIFRRITGATNSKKISKDLMISTTESEVEGLRRRLRALESEIREKNKLVAAYLKTDGGMKKKNKTILLSLESSKLIDHQVVVEKTFSGTIWDPNKEEDAKRCKSGLSLRESDTDQTLAVPHIY